MTKMNFISKECCDCDDNPDCVFYKPFKGAVTPKSIASESCTDRKMYDCKDTRVFGTGDAPSNISHSLYVLNRNFGLTNAENFWDSRIDSNIIVDGVVEKEHIGGCPNIVQATYCDPRVRNQPTGELIKLDRKPYTGHVPLDEIYSESLRNYGTGYNTYSDINGGQIRYYVSDDNYSAFQEPMFALRADETKTVRKDPMGSLLPEYYREPLTYGLKNVSPYQDTRDQLRYREDIMEGIVYNQNKQSWGKLWYSEYSKNNPGPEGKTTWSYKA